MAPVAIVEGLAQGRYLNLEIIFLDRCAGPDLGQEVVLVDSALAGLGENPEDCERTAAEPNGHAVAKERLPVEIEPEPPESDFTSVHCADQFLRS
jgi:hypothetical protein